GDDILIKPEKAPNAAGARALGFVESGDVGDAALAIVLGHAAAGDALSSVENVILIDTHDSALASRAMVALPARTFAERAGTFTNHAKRVQRFLPFLEPRFEAWAEGDILTRLAASAGLDTDAWDVNAVSKRLSQEVPAFEGIDLDSVGDRGLELR
ncbi:MAG: molybdopterin-dependent oxidoreductase, partial [Deltaproteobacteria bacterium]|nr:molybdopterin-dependent oxidoreductase [Deltaproteobacteria bacterium]